MNALFWKFIRRSRPRIGWRQIWLGLAAALCPAFAASTSELGLPAGLFFWAGLLGLLLGLRGGRPATDPATPRPLSGGALWTKDRAGERHPAAGSEAGNSQHLSTHSTGPSAGSAARVMFQALRLTFWLAIVLGIGALLVVAAGQTLPPFGLVAQDIAALISWVGAALRRTAGFGDMPAARTWEFMSASLPRFWNNLAIAPNDGERGARLLVAAGGVLTTWFGALILGWALARRRNIIGWGTPLLVTIALTAILGGSTSMALLVGLPLLLLLALVAGFGRRELAWDRAGTDYSDELGTDVLACGAGVVTILLGLALVLPTSLSNPLADLIWRDVELPSGIAVLEKNIPRPQPPPKKADIGLSTLPALPLGLSLEQPPPDKVVLRVRLDAPLKPSPWPRYWRARVFNLYNGVGWTTNARIISFDPSPPVAGTIPGGILQEIEDLRTSSTILVGLPDIFNASVPVQAERLPDGELAALTKQSEATRYRILSRPQELAPPPQTDGPPPDLSDYLQLPKNYPPRVGDLARAVAGRAGNSYDQALALEGYLRGLRYSYEVRLPPRSGDVVEQFLFDMREGYCTYYASAMAVMARSLGIPARVAIGYATGEYDQASGVYAVREADAHAWPELYIDGRWVPFEPTPIRVLPARTLPQEAPAPESALAPDQQPEQTSGPLIWAAVVALVVLATFAGIRLGQPRRTRSLATQVQQQLERRGARAGVPWPIGTTLREYGELLEPHARDDTSALHDVVDLIGQARYGGRPLHGEEEGRLRAAAERVWARLGRR